MMRGAVALAVLLAGVPLLSGCPAPTAARTAAPAASRVEFTDVTEQAGIRFVHKHGGIGKKYFVETSGAGCAFFDYDNDGKPDLYVVQSGILPTQPGFGKDGNRSALYHNEGGGRFTDVTDHAGVGNFRYGQGCCAGDFDGDGWLDLYVTNFGANRLYRNNHDGTFTDVAPKVGATCPGYNTGCAFADVDGDGRLDLYVARYAKYTIGSDPPCSQAPGLHSYCPPSQFDGDPDVLLQAGAAGTFTDITQAAGVSDPHGRGLGVLFLDYNDDAKPDLFVANDGCLNRLYENLGGGKFRDVTSTAGVGLNENGSAAAGMGVDAADYDGDGRLDVFVADFTSEPSELFHNLGDGAFENSSASTGVGAPSIPYTSFGAAFLDYDLDGYPDLLVANGHVADDIAKATPGITYPEPKQLLRNLGTGRFQDVSKAVGSAFRRLEVSRGLALADVDGDGDLDAFVNNSNAPGALFRSDGGRNQWIHLRLRASKGDPFALGARVVLEAGGRKQIHEVRSGTSYCSQHDLTQVFGLGGLRKADRVEVRWPDGRTQEWRDLPAGQVHVLTEGGP